MINSDEMKRVKHLFMTYRNGIIADSLRKAGMPYRVIFGLQLPQIRQIATDLKACLSEETLTELARTLWLDCNVRESRILAMAIFPPDRLKESDAKIMASEILTREEADMLSFLLIRHTPHLSALISYLESVKPLSPTQEYTKEALYRFLPDFNNQ